MDESQFPDTPQGLAERWRVELDAAREELKEFHGEGVDAINAFRGKDGPGRARRSKVNPTGTTKWNLYNADTRTVLEQMLGNTPKVDVERAFGDANDQVARVAGELLERILSNDIHTDGRSYERAIGDALWDAEVPGLGNARVRYIAQFEEDEGAEEIPEDEEGKGGAPPVPPTPKKRKEDVEVFYVHWNDQLWSPCKVVEELRWWAFRAEMSQKQLCERFSVSLGRMEHEAKLKKAAKRNGEDLDDVEIPEISDEDAEKLGERLAKAIPLNSKKGGRKEEGDDANGKKKNMPWARAQVWEIWDKEERCVYWYVDGFGRILDYQEDPLGLKGFWPCPEAMMANLVTEQLVPTSDWSLTKDMYEEVNLLSSRITRLERSLKVKGLYDQNVDALKDLINDSNENEMIPVPNWAMFSEKGGIKGAVDWFPLEAVVETLEKLRDVRRELVDEIRQIRGIPDIMRGQATENGTPGEARIEAQAGSVKLRAKQKRFARFASELQAIKAEVIACHFEPETILERSNAAETFDGEDQGLLMQAVQLIKDKFHDYRITVKPESIALEDFAAMKAERTEFIGGMADFFQKIAPIAQALPGSMPGFVDVAKWAAAGLKGGKEIEGVFDRIAQQAAQAAQNQAQQPQQNPEALKAQAAQQQAQAKMQELQIKAQIDQQHLQAQTQADIQRDESQARQQAQEEQQAHAMSMEEDRVRAQLDIEKQRAIQAMKPPPTVSIAPQPRPRR